MIAMTAKTTCLFLIGICIILILTIVVAKFIVIPIKVTTSNNEIKISKLTEENKDLLTKLNDAEKVVRDKIFVSEEAKLLKYISNHTKTLSDGMIKEAAASLVNSSKVKGIPIELIVGISQATSNFNTTYLVDSGHRGILALPQMYWITMKNTKDINIAAIGAASGADVLCELKTKHKELDKVLVAYFNDSEYSRQHRADIYKAAIEYAFYN